MEAAAAGCLPILPNSLAYPEHTPDSLSALLYNSTEAFHEKLLNICRDPGIMRNFTAAMQHIAMQYDWKTQAVVYDRAFEEMI